MNNIHCLVLLLLHKQVFVSAFNTYTVIYISFTMSTNEFSQAYGSLVNVAMYAIKQNPNNDQMRTQLTENMMQAFEDTMANIDNANFVNHDKNHNQIVSTHTYPHDHSRYQHSHFNRQSNNIQSFDNNYINRDRKQRNRYQNDNHKHRHWHLHSKYNPKHNGRRPKRKNTFHNKDRNLNSFRMKKNKLKNFSYKEKHYINKENKHHKHNISTNQSRWNQNRKKTDHNTATKQTNNEIHDF